MNFFTKWPPAAILDDRKSVWIAFIAISDQCTPFLFLEICTKWPSAAILDDRKSPLFAFLAISDQYEAYFFLYIFYCDTNARIKFIFDTAIDDLEWKNPIDFGENLKNQNGRR